MPPHGRTVQSLAETEHLEPEVALAAAILRQLAKDARSPHSAIRQDAHAFLADASQVGFWADALGVDQSYLVHGLRAAALQRGP